MSSSPPRANTDPASPYREELRLVKVKMLDPNAPGLRAMARDQSRRIAESEAENDLLDWSEKASAGVWDTLPP